MITLEASETAGAQLRALLEHACRPHRNYFCATVNSEDDRRWMVLVGLGLAIFGRLINDGRARYYHVSPAGRALIGVGVEKPEIAPEPFDTADFYDARNSDEASHETVEEAVEDFLDTLSDSQAPIEDEIRRLCAGGLEVRALQQQTIAQQAPGWVESTADDLLLRVDEEGSEKFGDPDACSDLWSTVDLGRLRARFLEALTELAQTNSWHLADAGARTFSASEVVEMMRAYRPDWFNDTKEDSCP